LTAFLFQTEAPPLLGFRNPLQVQALLISRLQDEPTRLNI